MSMKPQGMVRIRNVKAAQETHYSHVGRLVKAAGLRTELHWDPKKRQNVVWVEDRAQSLTMKELIQLAQSTLPEPPPKKEESPSYEELVTALEQANTLIEALTLENTQLHKQLTIENNLKDRARLALTAAGRHQKMRW